MSGFKKFFKDIKSEYILGIIGLVILFIALFNYSNNKNLLQIGYNNRTPLQPASVNQQSTTNVKASSNQSTYAPYNGTSTLSTPTSVDSANRINLNKPVANPKDLLPINSNNSWASMNPATMNLKQVNLLNPSQIAGINTQGSSLRNANLQLRSEPPNPRTATNCPWNTSTIEPDTIRKSLEIGSQC